MKVNRMEQWVCWVKWQPNPKSKLFDMTMHAKVERDLGIVIDSESSVSSCDDLPNSMEDDMENFEVVE
ncbi:hypothetical protein ACFX1R_037111 [Malus domestica]